MPQTPVVYLAVCFCSYFPLGPSTTSPIPCCSVRSHVFNSSLPHTLRYTCDEKGCDVSSSLREISCNRWVIAPELASATADPVMSEDGPCLLKVGESMLAGEIEYRKGNFAVAFDHLREAVR